MPASYGIKKNLFTDNTLDEWHDVYKKIPTTTTTEYGDKCWGIDINSLAYRWFIKIVMPSIRDQLGSDLNLIFSTYIDADHPLLIHDDVKPLPIGIEGKQAFSVLIPYSVDHKKDTFEKVGTCFYDNNKKMIERLSWEQGSMIWWQSNLLHSSTDFRAEGIKSKQYFVTHTYV